MIEVDGPLSSERVEQFIVDGAVRLDAAFPHELADECRRLLWEATGCDPRDRSTWTRPVVRIDGRGDAPFAAAANTERLHAAYNQLAGPDRWVPRDGLGTFPVRFPIEEEPGDEGWHIESTGADADDRPIVDPSSQQRVLLLLFLFSDVGPNDAPTRLRLGSHLEAARLLSRAGQPVDFVGVAKRLVPLTNHLPEAVASGAAGDVWLCHPFVVHAARRHRGERVRFMAQPPLEGTEPLDPTRPGDQRSAVEEAIRRGHKGHRP